MLVTCALPGVSSCGPLRLHEFVARGGNAAERVTVTVSARPVAPRGLAAAESARQATIGGIGDGAHHLGDAVEWLYASYGADARGAVVEAQARALLRELRECVGCVAESRR